MLSTLLKGQQLRCLGQFGKQTLVAASILPSTSKFSTLVTIHKLNTPLVPLANKNNALIPVTNLSTTATKCSADHGKIWAAEKIVSLAMFPSMLLPFFYTTPWTDAYFCTIAILHAHWGKNGPF